MQPPKSQRSSECPRGDVYLNPGTGGGSGCEIALDPGAGGGDCSTVDPGISALVRTAEKNTAAAAAWQAIQRRQQPPLCSGHRQPAVIRTVKKGGENQGVIDRGVANFAAVI